MAGSMTGMIVVTCEHASNQIPAAWQHLFAGAADPLRSHWGWDLGARELAAELAACFSAPLLAGTVSRLLVDLNRSLDNPDLWSQYSRGLEDGQKQVLVRGFWQPFRGATADAVARAVHTCGACVHLSVHSFTPVWNGLRRETDIGLLYDPARAREEAVVEALRERLCAHLPDLAIRRNDPYEGIADGHTTALRRVFPDAAYAGIELEISQAWVEDASRWARLRQQILAALKEGDWLRAGTHSTHSYGS